jgi:hypothetical protein
VGGWVILIGCDHREIVALRRKDLSVYWRGRVKDLAPMYWWGDDLYLMAEELGYAVWDLKEKRVVWRAESEVFSQRWNGFITTWPKVNEVELRDPRTGRVQRTLKVIGPGAVRGDLLVCRPSSVRDPLQAVRQDGSVAWQRDVLPELHAAQGGGPGSKEFVGLIAASTPGLVILTYGSASMACSLEDGRTQWRRGMHIPYHAAVDGGRIYLMERERFVVIDETTGEPLCERQHDVLAGIFRESAGAVGGDLVAFSSESGHVVVFDRNDGDLVLYQRHDQVAFWGTAVADGRVLVSGSDGKLWVYEAA